MKTLLTIVAIIALAYFAYEGVKRTQPAAEQASTKEPTAKAEPAEQAAEAPVSLMSNAAEGASVSILEPADGAVVSSPVAIKFGISNMSVAKAGDNQPNSGHHHLLIDMDELPALDAPLPSTDKLIHFGGGQTETTIELSPGQHTLQLLLGNYLHIPHTDPVISKKITITVE